MDFNMPLSYTKPSTNPADAVAEAGEALEVLEAAFRRYDPSPAQRTEMRVDPRRALLCLHHAEHSHGVRNPFALAFSMFRNGRFTATVNDTNDVVDEEGLALKVESWIRTAGRTFPTWAEVEDEIFERGLGGGTKSGLRIAKRDDLVARFYGVWLQARPGGIETERDAEQRAQAWKRAWPERRAKPRQGGFTPPFPIPADAPAWVHEWARRRAAGDMRPLEEQRVGYEELGYEWPNG